LRARQREREYDEWESDAVIETALGGESETHAVAIAGVTQLHIRCQHRIRRRNNRRQQQRGSKRQAEHQLCEPGHRQNRQHQRADREPQGDRPVAVSQRQAHLQADAEQRNQHRSLGHHLQHSGVLEGIDPE